MCCSAFHATRPPHTASHNLPCCQLLPHLRDLPHLRCHHQDSPGGQALRISSGLVFEHFLLTCFVPMGPTLSNGWQKKAGGFRLVVSCVGSCLKPKTWKCFFLHCPAAGACSIGLTTDWSTSHKRLPRKWPGLGPRRHCSFFPPNEREFDCSSSCAPCLRCHHLH